jgi:hypothetical protein
MRLEAGGLSLVKDDASLDFLSLWPGANKKPQAIECRLGTHGRPRAVPPQLPYEEYRIQNTEFRMASKSAYTTVAMYSTIF